MTKRKVIGRRKRRQPGQDPTQETRILRALERWCEQQPGRSFTVARTPEGWTARLDETQAARGTTLVDAAAQIAVAAAFASPGPDEVTS